jgi:RecA/RadA recombinase
MSDERRIFDGAEALTPELGKVLGVDIDQVHRVVIDLQAGEIAMVYVEMAASLKVLDLAPTLAKSVTIRIVDRPAEDAPSTP